jgi:transcriptional regulator
MYLPAHFKSQDKAHALELIREYPLVTLISNDDEGFPFASHVPLHLQENIQNQEIGFSLLGHFARANPHVAYLRKNPMALVTVMGPQAYMPARVYIDTQRVPTWSYLTVHLKVKATFIDDLEAKDKLLKKLITDHDPAYVSQWKGLPTDYQQRMLKAIDPFELEVLSYECKIKLNQHRPESHQAMYDQYAKGSEQEKALAQWMIKLGLVK